MATSLVVPETPMRVDWRELLRRAKVALAEGREIEGGIDPNEAEHSPYQPRRFFGADSLRRLGNSMESMGQIYPGIVRRVNRRDKPYEVLDGERRWRASKFKHLPRYRAILVKIDDEAAAFLIAAIANLNREGHTAVEISDSIVGMLNLDIPMPEVADMLGISVFWATQLHGLRNLHPTVRDMLDPSLKRDQLLPVTAAIQISKADPSVQIALATKTLQKKISLKGLRSEVVRVSRKEGVHIRERTVRPHERWKSIRALSGQVLRISQDLEQMLGVEGITQNRPTLEIREMIDKLDGAKEHLAGSLKLLRTVK